MAFALLAACGDNGEPHRTKLVPRIDGDWWSISGIPDLGELNGPDQQPVDFSVWRDANATWHLWSCIRFTKVGGNTRLFYEWTSPSLFATDWTPRGIAMRADAAFGEAEGGLQAPHVFRDGAKYHLFYGAWQSICSATSGDGVTFTRVLDANGQCPLFTEGPEANTRDPMVARTRDHWEVVYTAFGPDGAPVYARTSKDLVHWSKSHVIAFGGIAGKHGSSGESPFLVYRDDVDAYFLVRTHAYGAEAATEVYESADPLVFGIDDDHRLVTTLPIMSPELVEENGETYAVAFKPDIDGMRIAHLVWDVTP